MNETSPNKARAGAEDSNQQDSSHDSGHQVSLHPGEARELAELLGTVEDWLLHTDEETLYHLTRFTFSSACYRPGMQVGWFTPSLGSYACLLLRRIAGESL